MLLALVAAAHAAPIPYDQTIFYAAPAGYTWSLVPVSRFTNHDQLDAFPTVVEGRRRLDDEATAVDRPSAAQESFFDAQASSALYAQTHAAQGAQIPYYPGVHTYSWPQPPLFHHPRPVWPQPHPHPQPQPVPGMVPGYNPGVPQVPRPAMPGGPRGPPEIETEAETFQPRPDPGTGMVQQPPSPRNWDPLVRRVVVSGPVFAAKKCITHRLLQLQYDSKGGQQEEQVRNFAYAGADRILVLR